jgi:hypothetical protein
VVQDVDAGHLVWIGLLDSGAHVHSCLYQRSGYTTTVAMATFLANLETEVSDIRERFDALHARRLQSFK